MNVQEFLIDENATMLEAMAQLDEVAKKNLFVVRDNKFVAVITDGDIRRWILKKGNLVAKVKDIANYNPKYIYIKDEVDSRKYLKKYKVDALPIVDENKNIVSIVFWNDEKIGLEHKLNIPVVIMAGGKGTRLYPYTKIHLTVMV